MKIYTLHKQQKVPITVNEAWEFLSNPENLIKMTPKEMKFSIASKIDRPLYAGQIIQYNISPIPGIKSKWVSEITQVVPKKYFVDIQLYGPYALWHHKHFIHEIENGVILEDIVDYKVPFGFLGRWVHPIIVKPKLEQIFQYRKDKIVALFGTYKND